MATQGVVSVMSGGKVVMKIVAGCDGYQAQVLADELKAAWPVSAKEAFIEAFNCNFGDIHSLVVVTESEIYFQCDEDPSPLYRETFNDPNFNPRWKQGTADHIVVVEV